MAKLGFLVLFLLGLKQAASLVNIDCTFDVNLCVWHHDQNRSPLTWRRVSGGTGTGMTGPTGDHTSGNGYYIYLEASGATAGQFASMISPFILGNGCFEFYYHMYGDNIGKLEVYEEYKQGFQTAGESLLWSKSGDQGNVWQKASVFIPYNADEVRIRLTAYVGAGGARGDIAVDDVKFIQDGTNCGGV